MPPTEHSEFDSLVMYARRKIDSSSDMFSYRIASTAVSIFFSPSKLVPAYMACLTEYSDTLSVFTSSFSRYDEDHLYR